MFTMRPDNPRPHEVAVIDCGADDAFVVQVSESPLRRSVQIHVNNEQVWKGLA
jgi:hypothetical protein